MGAALAVVGTTTVSATSARMYCQLARIALLLTAPPQPQEPSVEADPMGRRRDRSITPEKVARHARPLLQSRDTLSGTTLFHCESRHAGVFQGNAPGQRGGTQR